MAFSECRYCPGKLQRHCEHCEFWYCTACQTTYDIPRGTDTMDNRKRESMKRKQEGR